MKGWVGLVGWPVADRFTHIVVTRRLQAERRTGSVRRPKTGVLPTVLPTNDRLGPFTKHSLAFRLSTFVRMDDFITGVAEVSGDLGEHVAHLLCGFADTRPSWGGMSHLFRSEDLVAQRQTVDGVGRRSAGAPGSRFEKCDAKNTKHIHLRVAVDTRHAILARAAHLRVWSYDKRPNNFSAAMYYSIYAWALRSTHSIIYSTVHSGKKMLLQSCD